MIKQDLPVAAPCRANACKFADGMVHPGQPFDLERHGFTCRTPVGRTVEWMVYHRECSPIGDHSKDDKILIR